MVELLKETMTWLNRNGGAAHSIRLRTNRPFMVRGNDPLNKLGASREALRAQKGFIGAFPKTGNVRADFNDKRIYQALSTSIIFKLFF